MSLMDAARPPKKNKTAVRTQALPPSQAAPAKPSSASLSPADHANKKSLMWLSVIVIMVIIFVGWVILLQTGKLGTSSGSTLPSELGHKITNLWNTIKTDVLKIKSTLKNTNNTNQSDEQIKQLEDKVFPQFNNPSQQ